MPSCAVLTCKNESRKKNVSFGGVSYHRFPQDPFYKEKWIEATGRQNWMPSKLSTICSEHFTDENIEITNKGYRHLNDEAIPTKNILLFKDYNNSESPSPSRKPLHVTQSKKARQAIDSTLISSPTNLSPKITKIRKQLQWSQSKITRLNLKVKRLQSVNRRLNKKVENMSELLKCLQKKFSVKDEDLDSLKNNIVRESVVV